MGLDMYLNAKRFFWHNEKELSDTIRAALGLEQQLEVKEVTLRAGYWRKANHIHAWFVANVQEGKDECQEADVTREQLTTLRDLCRTVLNNRDKAPELLPTQSGFFFGSTDYDEYYFSDLTETIEQINKALELPDCWYFTYRSSW